ncbi:MAG: phosphate ABC transporter ATP-binding protein [Kiritimatiellaeota bacterium]|nr:phosphate ABC transporter ATP-binding protein [Kiritimatiellota bacterium]
MNAVETKNGLKKNGATCEVAVSTEKFSIFYSDFEAVKGVSFDIPRRGVTAIIGPSGCGKSTLLRGVNRMNDLIPGTRVAGRMLFDGVDIYDSKVDVVKLRKRVGMVFQKPNVFPKSIFDNVAYGPRLHGVRKRSQLFDIVEKSLLRAAIWDEVKDRLGANAIGLSGGQQQRLCIARALAIKPEVLLMDEPTSALDPKSTAKIEDLVMELREDYTIVIVTHNMQQAARISRRTAFMYEGGLVEYDDTEKIFTTPSEIETENYITGKFG